MSKTINLILIGFGPHARRIYYPIINKEENKLDAKIVCAIDLQSKKTIIEEYLLTKNDKLPVFYIKNSHKGRFLHQKTQVLLNKIITQYNIQGVIIATEPLVHISYAYWALSKGLNILMDKPISTVKNSSISLEAAKQIMDDYKFLKSTYLKAKTKFNSLRFILMAQRRYHPAFQKIKDLIREVFERTNCPVTSVQSFHSDGQWRLPSEIIDIKYHSFNYGYGKCSHTGYHALDIVPWLLEAAESPEKNINNIDVFTNFVRPIDYISQINLEDYKKIFTNFEKINVYSESQFKKITYKYGEVDAFNSIAFKHDDKNITLASLNFIHNGFSQRGWLEPKKDLYKGNGRVRHESHLIEQGPFQAISFISYQSSEIDPTNKNNLYEVGSEYHLDIHVFRNHNLFPRWKNYEKYSIKDLNQNIVSGYSRGHQEDARRKCIIEFINLIRGKTKQSLSDYLNHEKGTNLLSAVYLSASKRFNKQNPLVNVMI